MTIVTSIDRGHGSVGRAMRVLTAAVIAVLLGDLVALAAHDGGSTARSLAEQSGDGGAGQSAPGSDGEALPIPIPVPNAAGTATTRPASGSGKGSAGSSATTTTAVGAAGSATPTTLLPPYTYEVTLTPTCARVGEDFTVTFKVQPSTAVGVIAVFNGRDRVMTQDSMWGTTAGDDGVVVHTWKAPAAPGPGQLLTGATTADGKSGGTPLDFEIVEPTKSC